MKEAVHAKVLFFGKVQGVGFRVTAQLIAKEMGITGFVKNLSNGCVELQVETPRMLLKEYLNRLENEFLGISDIKVSTSPPQDNFSEFLILS